MRSFKHTKDTKDDDPSNMLLRAGYLLGLSVKQHLDAEDRDMLQRASRSLQYAAKVLRERRALKDETKLRAALADFMSDWWIAAGEEQPEGALLSDINELISIFRKHG